MSKNLDQLQEKLKKDPELFENLNSEAKRIFDEKEMDHLEDLMIKTVKNVSDIELTSDDFKELASETGELSPDDLENVGGGWSLKDVYRKAKQVVKDGNSCCEKYLGVGYDDFQEWVYREVADYYCNNSD